MYFRVQITELSSHLVVSRSRSSLYSSGSPLQSSNHQSTDNNNSVNSGSTIQDAPNHQQHKTSANAKMIQLDIVAETGQIIRRLSFGRMHCPQVIHFNSSGVSHVTNSAISFVLRSSGQSLGRHTMTFVDLRENALDRQVHRVFTFARNNSPHVYKLLVRVEFVQYQYLFQLDRITCLNQNRWFSPDLLRAIVEFNVCSSSSSSHCSSSSSSSHKNKEDGDGDGNDNGGGMRRNEASKSTSMMISSGSGSGGSTVYDLGYLKQHEASHLFSSHHLSFVTIGSFRIKFYTKRLHIQNALIDEWSFQLVKTRRKQMMNRAIERNDENDRIEEHESNDEHDDRGDNSSHTSEKSHEMSVEEEEDEELVWTRRYETNSSNNNEVYFAFDSLDAPSHISRVTTIDCATCSYQLHFTITRKPIMTNTTIQNMKSILSIDSQSQRQYEESFTNDYLEHKKKLSEVNSKTFTSISSDNEVEVLIDGLQTFGRYYHYMMQAQESIDILAWELSLSFGLVFAKRESRLYKKFLDPSSGDSMNMQFSPRLKDSEQLDFRKYYDSLRFLNRMFQTSFPQLKSKGRWVTLQDVILTKAASGVKVRLMVWRHKLLSYLMKFVYLGEVTIEREAEKLKKRAAKMGLKVAIFHTDFNLPSASSPYADPYSVNWKDDNANIVLVIVGNPKGMVSCHHEKLLLIDAEKPNRCVSFVGGFDIARGRYDQPLHFPPISTWTWGTLMKAAMKRNDDDDRTFDDESIQPFLRNIRLLWHDNQVMIRGSATRIFHLHFVQRWTHAFTGDNYKVRELTLPEFHGGEPMTDPVNASIHKNVTLRVLRSWPGVFATHTLVDNFCNLIRSAQDYIYVEHQYPFHNVSLTQCLCESLQRNKNLKVVIITPVRTDLPTGVIGRYFDASQDQIDEHLRLIYSIAPLRVGVYGLVTQEPKSKILKSIYVHSKLVIVDGKVMANGSANMDTLSFFKSSEFNVNFFNEAISQETLERLAREHLEDYYTDDMKNNNFDRVFEAFRAAGEHNLRSLKDKGILSCRVFPMVPRASYRLITTMVNYPNQISKALFKLGLSPDMIIQNMISNVKESSETDAAEQSSNATRTNFYLQSNL